MLLVEGANLTLKIGTTVEADFKYFHCTENSGDIFSLSRNIPDSRQDIWTLLSLRDHVLSRATGIRAQKAERGLCRFDYC
jgi:hypothetical protein